MASKVSDGASLRKRRILSLLAYIKQNNPEGCPIRSCQSYMLGKYGLKFETTSKMIQELDVGGWIRVSEGSRLFTTTQYEKHAGILYDEE